jgi:acyl-CoA synthetase (AMP-forming)/AMP-acid ligase II
MDPIALHAARQPDRPAIIEGDRVLTWAAFAERRNRLARGLAPLGLAPGEHAVVYAYNSTDVLVTTAALRALGAIGVPMNHRLAAEEVAYIVADADATVVFVGDDFVGIAERVRHDVPSVRHWILLGAERRPWAVALADLIAGRDGSPLPVGDGATGGSMIYTAGTTGRPKGALRRAIDPARVIPRLAAFDLVDPSHVHLVAGPLYHSAPGAFALFTHLLGGTVVVLPHFDPEAALRAIADHRCTSTFMAPTLLKRLVELPAAVRARHDVSSMRVVIVAAAPCPMAVKEAVVAWFGPVLYEFYGSTELGINTVLRPEDVLRKPGSCGRAAPDVELAILDDDGRVVPRGTPGEVHVRRDDGMFDEYWKNPAATRDAVRGDWLSVGDVAWMDDEGFVYICDRKRDMIISGGVNVYPAEVEDVLHRHPAVMDVAVFGVPDDAWGERVHAAVHPRAGVPVDADDLRAFAREHLAGFKVPRTVSFHADFPRDAAGKLVKRVLRDPYWAGRTTRV